jgi:hypothetical protein
MEEDIPDPVVVLDLLKILTTPSLQSAATGSSEEFGPVSINTFHISLTKLLSHTPVIITLFTLYIWVIIKKWRYK